MTSPVAGERALSPDPGVARLRTAYLDHGGWTPGFDRLVKLALDRARRRRGCPRKLLEVWVADNPGRRATHQQIAEEIGTVREVVTRELGKLEAEGVVERRGRMRCAYRLVRL